MIVALVTKDHSCGNPKSWSAVDNESKDAGHHGVQDRSFGVGLIQESRDDDLQLRCRKEVNDGPSEIEIAHSHSDGDDRNYVLYGGGNGRGGLDFSDFRSAFIPRSKDYDCGREDALCDVSDCWSESRREVKCNSDDKVLDFDNTSRYQVTSSNSDYEMKNSKGTEIFEQIKDREHVVIDLKESRNKNLSMGATDLTYQSAALSAPRPVESSTTPDAPMQADIFHLIEERKWKVVAEQIQANPALAAQSVPRGGPCTGNLTLHEVCKLGPPSEVVRALVQANNVATQTMDQWGYLPLHYACASGGSPEIVELLIGAFPGAVRTRDGRDSMLPLHLACKLGNTSEDIYMSLLKEYPDAINVCDRNAKTPMDYAVSLRCHDSRDLAVRCLRRGADLLETSRSLPWDIETEVGRHEEILIEAKCVGQGSLERQLRNELETEYSQRIALEKIIQEKECSYKNCLEAQQEDVEDLLGTNEHLKSECCRLKELLSVQDRKIAAMEAEHKIVITLYESQTHHKESLERKIEALERAQLLKEESICHLHHTHLEQLRGMEEIHSIQNENLQSRFDRELVDALMDQEEAYQVFLDEEQSRVEGLELQIKDTKASHDMMTKSLIEKHKKEANKFRDLTKKFRGLESQLRRELEKEATRRKTMEEVLNQQEDGLSSLIESEKARVEVMEERHNDIEVLLEAERLKLIEAEMRFVRELDNERKRRKKLEVDLYETEETYKGHMRVEQNKVATSHELLGNYKSQLMEEQRLIKTLQAKISELSQMLQVERDSVDELRSSQKANEARLQSQQKELVALQQSYSQTLDNFETENQKVHELELEQSHLFELLKFEQSKVTELEGSRSKTLALLETERRKVKVLQGNQQKKQAVQDSLQRRVSELENGELQLKALLETERRKASTAKHANGELKAILDAAEEKFQALQQSEAEMEALLEKEHVKAKELEKSLSGTELVRLEGNVEKPKQRWQFSLKKLEENETPRESRAQMASDQSKLKDLERIANGMRMLIASQAMELGASQQTLLKLGRITSLDKQRLQNSVAGGYDIHADLMKQLETEKLNAARLEQSLSETQAFLDLEQGRLEDLGKAQAGNHSALQLAIYDLNELEQTQEKTEMELNKEIEKVRVLEEQKVEMEFRLDSQRVKVRALEGMLEEKQVLYDTEREKAMALEQMLAGKEGELILEKLKKDGGVIGQSGVGAHFDSEQHWINALVCEQTELKTASKSEEIKLVSLEQEQGWQRVLSESEKNKVKALEHAQTQNNAILEWEQRTVQTLQETHRQTLDILEMERKKWTKLEKGEIQNDICHMPGYLDKEDMEMRKIDSMSIVKALIAVEGTGDKPGCIAVNQEDFGLQAATSVRDAKLKAVDCGLGMKRKNTPFLFGLVTLSRVCLNPPLYKSQHSTQSTK